MASKYIKNMIVSSNDDYFRVMQVSHRNLKVMPIWTANDSKLKNMAVQRLDCHTDNIEISSYGEIRLMYLAKNGTKRHRSVEVQRSSLPEAGKGLIVTAPLLRGSTINMHWYDIHESSRPKPPVYNHFTFYTKKLTMHKGRVPPSWMTIFPFQVCAGAFVNDGTKLMHKGELYHIPDSCNLVNAEIGFSIQHKLSIETVQDIPIGHEVFTNYGKRFWQPATIKHIVPPMFIFGDTPKEKLPSQLHKLYDYCYDTTEVVEESESEEDNLQTPPAPIPESQPLPEPEPLEESQVIQEPEPKSKRSRTVNTPPSMDIPDNDLKESIENAKVPPVKAKGNYVFPRSNRKSTSSKKTAADDDKFMFEESDTSSTTSSSDSDSGNDI